MKILKFFRNFIFRTLFSLAVCALSLSVFAEELSKVDSDALANTVKMMNSPTERQGVIDNSDGAKKADAMVKSMMGNEEDTQAVYKVAAEIFRSVAQENGGDLQSIIQTIGKAQSNPEEFYRNLSPEQKKMIMDLSKKAEAQKRLQNK